MDFATGPLFVLAAILGAIAIPVVVGWLLFHVVGLVFLVLGRVLALVGGILGDALRLVGSLLGVVLQVPSIVFSLLFLRWSRLGDHGERIERRLAGMARAVFRIGVGRPLALVGLRRPLEWAGGGRASGSPCEEHGVVGCCGTKSGVFVHVEADGGARGGDPGGDPFEGYRVEGELPRGGSGARILVARPVGAKAAHLQRLAGRPVDKVVIKSFALDEGSTMPQIVRESRALESARELGLVLEHQLSADRFHYVMPYVAGSDLAQVTRELHARSGEAGLDAGGLRAALNYFAELLVVLDKFHARGLWHKDIKPSNVIVSRGRVHLVDLGLVTPLRSAMTLTTHGTEYFRDPEMVRLAMQGVKVHEVDGVKFDLYSAGALLYSMLEASFPAHGSLSRFSKHVPESLRWVVRRAMADLPKRYGSASAMLADLEAVLASPNPFTLRPADLPSMRGKAPSLAGWDPGTTGASERVHGFEDRVADRVGAFGEDLAGAGERISRRLHRAGSRVEVHLGRRASQRGERPRPRRHGLLALALGGVAACLSLAILFLGVRSDRMSYAGPSYSVVYDDGGVAIQAPSAPGGPDRIESVAVSWEDPRALAEEAPPGRLAAPLAALEGSRSVLVLNDVGADDEGQPGVAAGLAELMTSLHGLELDVLGYTDEGEATYDAAATEHLAKARAAVGVSHIDDAAALERLESWLVDDPEVDAVLWIAHSDTGTLQTRVITE